MKKHLKKLIPPNSRLFHFISFIYKTLNGIPISNSIEEILNKYALQKKEVAFIQIGSNDGKTGDPINNHIINKNWKGILVEPVPYLFDRLKKNYLNQASNLIFENSAVSRLNGNMKFYRLKESSDPNLPAWYDQLGSFNKEVVLKHKPYIPGFDSLFIEDTINAITFTSLLEKYNFHKVNLIHIDTEGYDYEILKLIDFEKLDLDILIFEHKHLNEKDYKDALKYLRKNNFNLYSDGGDIIGLSKKLRIK